MSEINNVAATSETTAAVAAKAPLSKLEKLQARIDLLTKRIESDTAELPGLQAELEAQAQIEQVKDGSVVEVKQGRAETTRIEQAVVKGTKRTESGDLIFKVEIGEGFEATTSVIQAYQIVRVVSL